MKSERHYLVAAILLVAAMLPTKPLPQSQTPTDETQVL